MKIPACKSPAHKQSWRRQRHAALGMVGGEGILLDLIVGIPVIYLIVK
jgi:hypothetical protein